MITKRLFCILFTACLVSSINTSYAQSGGQHDLLFFLSAGPTKNEVSAEEGPEGDDLVVDANFLYSYLHGDFRALAEYIVSTEEGELERAQLGWQMGEKNIGWLGRFHSPGRYWNQVYHHGQYMQTSITRPVTDQFEDDAGFIPTHVSGVMFESSIEPEMAAGFEFAISVGAGPMIGDNQLVPFDILDTNSSNGAAADMRIGYVPDKLGDDQIGLTFGRYEMEVRGNVQAELQGLERVEQYTIGAYIDWRWQDWRMLTNVIRVINEMSRTTFSDTDAFFAGYLQAEYSPIQELTFFGRLEGTTDSTNSSYIALFPNSITDRQLIGVRYDYAPRNALTIEVGDAQTRLEEFGQAMIQWSTVFR